jgi:hypothetical protein
MAAAALKLIKEHPFAGVAESFVIVKRKPIDDIPWLYRVIMRWVFRRVRWGAQPQDSEGSFEIQGVFTDENLARANMKTGWAIHRIPVNVALPEETSFVGSMDIPTSPMSPEYKKIPCDSVSIKVHELNALTAGLGSRVKALKDATRRS